MVYRLIKWFAAIALRIMFVVDVEGLHNVPSTGSVVLCSNHTSWWDPPLVARINSRPIHFMAKKEMFENRLVARLLRNANAFPVDRQKADVGAIKQALRVLRDGNVLGIFPEGTRTSSLTGPSDMHAGAAMLALKADAPVVPLAIRGDYVFRGRIKVVVGKPFVLPKGNGRLSEDVQKGTQAIGRAIATLWEAAGKEEVA